jgi:hypothetical protein
MQTSNEFEHVFLRAKAAKSLYLNMEDGRAAVVFLAVQPAVMNVLKAAEEVLLGGQHPGQCFNHVGQEAIDYDSWEECVVHMATARNREEDLDLAISALGARIQNERDKAEMDSQS